MEIPALYELLRKRCRVLILKGLEKTKKNQFLYIFVKSFRSAFFWNFCTVYLTRKLGIGQLTQSPNACSFFHLKQDQFLYLVDFLKDGTRFMEITLNSWLEVVPVTLDLVHINIFR